MNKIRYLAFLLSVLACWPVAFAQGYDPASPAEPGVPPQRLTLLVSPAGAGSVSGGGRIVPQSDTWITASAAGDWTFSCWVDERGNVLSTDRSFMYTKKDKAETLIAQFVFTPGSPADPVPGVQQVYYRLDVATDGGGTVSGGGRYRSGTCVSLRAQCSTGFDFAGWIDEDGRVVSTLESFAYTTQAWNETLTATFRFNPDMPAEPGNPLLRHCITVVAADGGTVSGSCRELAGTTHTVTAWANSCYYFVGWYVDGELYSTQQSFAYTIGDSDITFEARFAFDPDSPGDPVMPKDKMYSFYLLSPVTYPGRNVECMVYLSNLLPLRDIRFNLTFPEGMEPDMNGIMKGEGFEDYSVTVTESGELSGYTITMAGGGVGSANRVMLRIPLAIPETTLLGTDYQLKINQVSVTQEDGTTCTASTRNGRVSVYKRGDTNGDGEVNILDRINLVGVIGTGTVNEGEFIQEVSDINDDGEFSILDVIGISDIIANE